MSKRAVSPGSDSESEIIQNIRELQKKLTRFRRKLKRKRQKKEANVVEPPAVPNEPPASVRWSIIDRAEEMSERFQARMLIVRTRVDVDVGGTASLLDIA